jgi:hypothetical protein
MDLHGCGGMDLHGSKQGRGEDLKAVRALNSGEKVRLGERNRWKKTYLIYPFPSPPWLPMCDIIHM